MKKKKFTKEQEKLLHDKCSELISLLKSFSDHDLNTLEEDPVFDLYEYIGDIWYCN